MKKIILLLTFLSLPSLAEWVPISKNLQGDTVYVDNKSILIEGHYLHYWELLDYKKVNKYGYRSATIFKKVSCNSTTFQSLKFISFTKPMGEGKIVNNYKPKEKITTASWGSSNYHSLRTACKQIKKIQ